ncbi:MAG: NAD(+)/NADH kinase [Gammaproteobacteria bacterium]|nr:NAD(+)/NADH kinase [Gammaproteobacteria bacterium]
MSAPQALQKRSLNKPGNSQIAICVNPMAGRDVRRLAARASTVTHEAKMDCVARIAAGADAMGVDEIFIVREPFRIAERAVEWMRLNANVKLLNIELTHDLSDTARAIDAFRAHGVDHVVALGGDGTHRVIVKTDPEIYLVPLSTGTNNVFPLTVEATIAGEVAALGAKGLLPRDRMCRRAKVAKLSIDNCVQDIGLIDVVRIENDFVGNYRPFDPLKLREMVLTRAEPDAIGMSPIGGLMEPVSADDDCGLYVKFGAGHKRRVPVSPGYFRDVHISKTKKLAFGHSCELESNGLIAIDGDRLHRIEDGQRVSVNINRDGPHVYDVSASMRFAAENGLCERVA